MAAFREETRTDIQELRTELRGEGAGMRQDMISLRAELLTNMAQLETRLMRWMLVAAGLGGVVGGLSAAVSKLFG